MVNSHTGFSLGFIVSLDVLFYSSLVNKFKSELTLCEAFVLCFKSLTFKPSELLELTVTSLNWGVIISKIQ